MRAEAGRGAVADIPRLPFDRDAPVAGFEIMTLGELRARRERSGRVERVHRGDFHSVSVTTAGRGRRTVDFVDYPCATGTVLWVRPGQVQQYHASDTVEGWHIIFTADFVASVPQVHALLDDGDPAVRLPVQQGEQLDQITAFCDLLAREHAVTAPSAPSVDALRLSLGAFLLVLSRGAPHRPDSAVEDGTYARFRALLEQRFDRDRSVTSYARLLGYSPRTLTRACIASTGLSAKTLIDDRVALEARRLLAHGTQSTAVIGRSLGFDEATNFVKFFRRHADMSPLAFRRSVLLASGSGDEPS